MATILLIHGAYQGGWIWAPTARALRALGNEVHTPTLDGCAERAHLLRPGLNTEAHADELAALLHFEDLRDVVVVGTSTGGMVLCRLAELAPERIGRLVFVDALALVDGERLSDIVVRRNAVTTTTSTGPSRDDASNRLFAELDDDWRTFALERYTPHPRAAMECPVQLGSFWQSAWTARVVWCRRSLNPPRAHQERTARALKADWRELDTGHYPMLQAPVALAEVIALP